MSCSLLHRWLWPCYVSHHRYFQIFCANNRWKTEAQCGQRLDKPATVCPCGPIKNVKAILLPWMYKTNLIVAKVPQLQHHHQPHLFISYFQLWNFLLDWRVTIKVMELKTVLFAAAAFQPTKNIWFQRSSRSNSNRSCLVSLKHRVFFVWVFVFCRGFSYMGQLGEV